MLLLHTILKSSDETLRKASTPCKVKARKDKDTSWLGSEQKERRSRAWNRMGPYSRTMQGMKSCEVEKSSGGRYETPSSPLVLGLQVVPVGGGRKHQGGGVGGGIRDGKTKFLLRLTKGQALQSF